MTIGKWERRPGHLAGVGEMSAVPTLPELPRAM
jgi:hypothetical protein